MELQTRKSRARIVLGAWSALAMLAFPAGASAEEIYKSDQGHTEIIFGWSHAGVSLQHGEFTKADGTLSLDPANIENSSISVEIAADSISTGVAALDTHLKSADFFDTEKFPTISFKSTAIKMTGDKTADVTGDLTIHGVTKPTTLKVTLTHRGAHPVAKFVSYYEGSWIAFSAQTEINHLEFGVGSYPAGPTDKITVQISTEMRLQQ